MTLYPHQVKGLEETEGMDHVAYYWDMGTGKTYVGAEKMMRLGARVNLVVCQKSKIQDWVDHFAENYAGNWTGDGIVVFDLTDSADLYSFIENTKVSEALQIQQVGIINYDLIWRRQELLQLHDFTLMLDESSLIQNETAKRSKFILKMKPKGVILLSGTPTGGKYENLWSQMHLLGWGISKKTYWNQYIEVEYLDTVGRSIPIVTGYKKVDRLKRKMHQYGCRFLKTEEVIDLPDQIFVPVRVDVSKEYRTFRKQRLLIVPYSQFEAGHKDGTYLELVGDTTLTKLLYERQLCGQYSKEKLQAFADLLESTNDRLIVFYNFTAELDALKAVCDIAGRPFGEVNGARKYLTPYEKCSDSVTFVQYQAGAMGLNLQKACRAIYFTLPLSSELFEQSKKRIHRIGQERPCFYYLMICRGSVEEKILRTLEMRQDYTEELFRKEEYK